jgi:predicted transcriptional regulator YheO
LKRSLRLVQEVATNRMGNEELQKYIPIANAITQTFGGNCEVVLHDLSLPQSSVIYTSNNNVTGREVGQPFNHIITQVLLSKNFHNDVVANYRTKTADGKEIKSTTVLLRDTKGEAIGALCINYDLTLINNMKQFLESFTSLEEEKLENEVEVMGNVQEIVDNLIARIVHQNDIEQMDRSQRIGLVRFMDEKGVFLIKGAMEKVADELKISKVTLYSYLEEIRSK